MMYAVDLEFDTTDTTPDAIDQLMDDFAEYHPTPHAGYRGRLAVTLVVPGDSPAQATKTALGLVALNPSRQMTAITVQADEQHAALQQRADVPPLVGATEAAAMIGISRQAVQQLHASGTLTGQKVGNALVMARADVESYAKAKTGATAG